MNAIKLIEENITGPGVDQAKRSIYCKWCKHDLSDIPPQEIVFHVQKSHPDKISPVGEHATED
jgi:hypothetical protein